MYSKPRVKDIKGEEKSKLGGKLSVNSEGRDL